MQNKQHHHYHHHHYHHHHHHRRRRRRRHHHHHYHHRHRKIRTFNKKVQKEKDTTQTGLVLRIEGGSKDSSKAELRSKSAKSLEFETV